MEIHIPSFPDLPLTFYQSGQIPFAIHPSVLVPPLQSILATAIHSS